MKEKENQISLLLLWIYTSERFTSTTARNVEFVKSILKVESEAKNVSKSVNVFFDYIYAGNNELFELSHFLNSQLLMHH